MIKQIYMATYSIKDLENLSGIKAHTIRIWEKRYNLVCPQRTDTNIRYYTDEDLKRLLNISILNKRGFKISKIADLNSDQLSEHIWNLSTQTYNTEAQIENMVIAMVDLDEVKINQILSDSIDKVGFETTILNLIYPFFNRVGILWQTGNINPAQEHFISNLIRQKMLAAIDKLYINPEVKNKTFVLFLPEGELHEIALLFLYFLVKKQGFKVIYLGQSVPLSDLYEVQQSVHADYFITYFTSVQRLQEIEDILNSLSDKFRKSKILVAGSHMESYYKELPNNVEKVVTISEMMTYLKEYV